MSNLKTLSPIIGVKTVSSIDPVSSDGRVRDLHCNSTTGEIFTKVDASTWKGTQGSSIGNILAFSHPDLIAAYTMDNISGATLVDETVNNNDGTIAGAFVGTGKIDNALQFVQTSLTVFDYVTIPDIVSGRASFATCFWMNLSPQVNDGCPIGWYDFVNNNRQYGIFVRDTTRQLELVVSDDGTSTSQLISTVTPNNAEWVFVYTHFDNGEIAISINGGPLDTLATGFSSLHNVSTLGGALGANVGGGGSVDVSGLALDGSLDQVRCFNRALTTQEITELYNEGVV